MIIWQSVSLKITVTPFVLRFENTANKKMLKQAWHFFFLKYLSVTTVGFKPTTAGAEIQCSIQLSYVANILLG